LAASAAMVAVRRSRAGPAAGTSQAISIVTKARSRS
jgi:hypothetical protein